MSSWPRYGVLASAYAAHVRETTPDVPVVAGVGRVFATHAAQTLAARETFRVEDLVPVALRRWRKQAGLSQRAAAEVLDLTPGLVARAEAQPGLLKLDLLVSLLRRTGHDLQVVGPDGAPVGQDLRAHEILPRTRSGRRFPGTAEVVPLTNEPRWMAARGEIFQSHGPQWTGERRPGQYP